MEIAQEQIGDVFVLAPVGRLDTDSESDFELAIQDLDSVGAKHFVVDMAQVGYISSAGLRVLVALAKQCEDGGSLRLAGLTPQVRQVFEVAGFARLFQMYADRKAAFDKHPKATVAAAPGAGKSKLGSLAASLLGAKDAAPKREGDTHKRVATRAAALMGVQGNATADGKAAATTPPEPAARPSGRK